jgi:hypothetical protein
MSRVYVLRILIFISGRMAQSSRKPRLLACAFTDSQSETEQGLTVLVAGIRDTRGLIPVFDGILALFLLYLTFDSL